MTPALFAQLQADLGDIYRWSSVSDVHPYGSPAIFSRHPVKAFRVLDLQADRAALMAEVDVGGTPVTFISAHLLAYGLVWAPHWEWPRMAEVRTADQRRQAERLANAIRDQSGSIIVGCDCNAQITSDSYRVLSQVLTEAARPAVGDPQGLAGLKTALDRRLERIDYQFYGGDLRVLGVYTVLESAGSDHDPILAEYAIDRRDRSTPMPGAQHDQVVPERDLRETRRATKHRGRGTLARTGADIAKHIDLRGGIWNRRTPMEMHRN